MAGHFPLSRIDENLIFEQLDSIAKKLVSWGNSNIHRTNKFPECNFTIPKKRMKVMLLSKDYVENAETEIAFLVGNFDLVSIADEHPSLIKRIKLECHFDTTTNKLLNVFWVA